MTILGWTDSKFKLTGRFTFSIGRFSIKTWSDNNSLVEMKLSEIVSKFEIEAQKIRAERLVYQEQQRIREESERIIREQQEEKQRFIREQQQRIEKEKSDFKDLLYSIPYSANQRAKKSQLIS